MSVNELKPSSVMAFKEALNGSKGELDAWLECNNEDEVRAHINALLSEQPQASAAQSAPVVPEGWQIERTGNGDIIVRAEGVGGAVVSAEGTALRQIPEVILYHLAETLLAAAPAQPAAQGVETHQINCNAVSQYPAGKCNCGKGE